MLRAGRGGLATRLQRHAARARHPESSPAEATTCQRAGSAHGKLNYPLQRQQRLYTQKTRGHTTKLARTACANQWQLLPNTHGIVYRTCAPSSSVHVNSTVELSGSDGADVDAAPLLSSLLSGTRASSSDTTTAWPAGAVWMCDRMGAWHKAAAHGPCLPGTSLQLPLAA
jgi:hypothetical protein